MKTKTIWIWAVIFGMLASGSLYLLLLPPAPTETMTPVVEAPQGEELPVAEPEAKINTSLEVEIQPGKRAVSISVDEVKGVSGFLVPGSMVDVILVTPPNKEALSKAFLLLENVKVLRAGNAVAWSVHKEQVKEYQTVTLEVSPEEGVSLGLATQTGLALHLMLRHPEDSSTAAPILQKFEELVEGERK
ncbi:Flp pilus assembly protein CpaB [Ammoniphilus sp. CFH 90114]|uniref:Flp pilus assembly protein CpaB n=1 Tax=Ammoniphilus sp. CFH 90114 TaxID=2493665 RepID=UPI00100EA11B|nr:Flp pilus assembly protein CpaB [Ammoniphilus sp. CFH 90114]RXT13563.1 Flp pilus assembly protein CpaB [Ammoniphilus sp. CFH 90114]